MLKKKIIYTAVHIHITYITKSQRNICCISYALLTFPFPSEQLPLAETPFKSVSNQITGYRDFADLSNTTLQTHTW